MPKRGWVIRDVKNPESIADHAFRAAIMAWILAKKGGHPVNIEKLIKMALIHDLCEVYAGDITPYDSILPKSKKKRLELVKIWPRFSEKERKRLAEKKYKKEKTALEKLTKNLPQKLRNEIRHLWLDYEKGLTKEGRFFKQADRLENFLQAVEYKKRYKRFPHGPWWEWSREFFDDPVFLELVKKISNKFHGETKSKK